MATKIKHLKDEDGKFFPYTHESAIICDDGGKLSEKVTQLDQKVGEIDEYYSAVSRRGTMEVWHTIIDYTKKFDVRATGTTVVARFSVNPYNPKPQHQFIIPDYECDTDVRVEMKICSDANCTNVIAEKGSMVEFADGTFVYVKYDIYYNDSVLGKKIRFAAKDAYGEFTGDTIETLSPITLFCESDFVTPMSGSIKVHSLNGGILTASGKKFGSDYRYLSKLTMDGVTPSGGGDISRISVGKNFELYVNASADNLGDTINIRVENAAVDVFVSNDTSPEYKGEGKDDSIAELVEKISALEERIKALEGGGSGGVKASYDESNNELSLIGASYNESDTSIIITGCTYNEMDNSLIF